MAKSEFDHLIVNDGMDRLVPVKGDHEQYGLELRAGKVFPVVPDNSAERGVSRSLAAVLVKNGVCDRCDAEGCRPPEKSAAPPGDKGGAAKTEKDADAKQEKDAPA